jgi:hypothetical protein
MRRSLGKVLDEKEGQIEVLDLDSLLKNSFRMSF